MLTYRFILSAIFQICLLLSGVAVFSQGSSGQWVGNLYLINCYSNTFLDSRVLVDENNKIQKIIPSLVIDKDFIGRSSNSQSNWYNGALYKNASGRLGDLEKNEDEQQLESCIFAKWQDDKWHSLGYYKMKSGKALIKAIPCDNDSFIVIFYNNEGMGHENKLKMTPFYRMSIPSGKTELSIDEAIDHDQDTLRMADPDHFKLAYESTIIMTNRHATLINKSSGLYWVFSLKNATLVKAGNIFKEETAKMITTGGFANSPILCANPEKKGTVLISAEDEASFTTENQSFREEYYNLLETEPYRSMSDDDILEKLYFPLQKKFAARNPNIVWYRIYPETGEVKKLKEPPEGGSSIRDGMNDNWRPMPDGSVSYFLPPNTYEALYAEVEKQLTDRIADFSPSIIMRWIQIRFETEFKKQLTNGIADFSIKTLATELEKQIKVIIPNFSLSTLIGEINRDVENQVVAELEQLKEGRGATPAPVLQSLANQFEAELKKQLENSIAATQKDKKSANTK